MLLNKTDELWTPVNKKHTQHIVHLTEHYIKLTEMLLTTVKHQLYEPASADKLWLKEEWLLS
jgi:hypothetical protein